jgi:hypothetical protein
MALSPCKAKQHLGVLGQKVWGLQQDTGGTLKVFALVLKSTGQELSRDQWYAQEGSCGEDRRSSSEA